MKTILVDSSSAILLYKSGWLDATLNHFHLMTPWAASREMTVPGHPGAALFQRLFERGQFHVLPADSADANGDDALNAMGAGESACIRHFLGGAGDFILLDDGRAAAYCRARKIPYVNALLMPRILALADDAIGPPAVADAMARIYALGRYARWVWDDARRMNEAALTPFRP